jgi:hypothetical protein
MRNLDKQDPLVIPVDPALPKKEQTKPPTPTRPDPNLRPGVSVKDGKWSYDPGKEAAEKLKQKQGLVKYWWEEIAAEVYHNAFCSGCESCKGDLNG